MTFERKVRVESVPGVIDTDTLASEETVTAEIDTSTETSPYVLLTPPLGSAVSTRMCLIQTDSGAGDVAVRFGTSANLIYKIYCSKFYGNPAPHLNIQGAADDPVVVDWSGVDTGAKIFVALTYKIV
ncbi:MAG: hypothetical protein JRD89_11970 [Deltaproteobacteria bacterium]|nr:hypothetical protein [Deltaproteobacteria bacterium]